MKLPLVSRRKHESSMRYAKAVVDALKKRYADQAMRAAMLRMENQTLRKQLEELRDKLEVEP